ncbi:MAG: hypothetical protein MOGMAGMI_02089 [Candidatus Omnitrophica bacterium]|nr:hypothetical protein [Candidatus Omnitrophota bacterium]
MIPSARLFQRVAVCLMLLWAASASVVHAADVSPRFEDLGDGTVRDRLYGLIWIKDPDRVPGIQGSMIWLQAKNGCEELEYAGRPAGTWRLPNITELENLQDDNFKSPRLDIRFFTAYSEPYWSSTDYSGSGPRAWTVHFGTGELGSSSKLSLTSPVRHRARCCRTDR